MATGSIKLGDLNNQISGGLWSSGSSILDWASERQQYKDSKKEEKANKQAAQFQVNSDSLLNSGLNSTDPKTSMMYMSGSSLEDLADAMDKFYFQTKRRHINRDKYPTANDIVNHWRETFPTSEVHINNLLNQTVDLPTTLERLGIALPSEEPVVQETVESEGEGGNFFGNVISNYVKPFYNHAGNAVANLINGGLEEIEQGTMFNPSETDYTMSALENYAQMKYGTNFYGLTEEQKNEAREVVATEEGMDMYKPTVQRVLTQGAEAGIDAYFAIAGWPIMALNSVGAEIPYVQDVLSAFGSIIGFGGHIINSLPILKQFRDSLQTEEEKEEWDQYVGGFGLWKLGGKKTKKINGDLGDFIIKNIKDPKDLIKQFQKLPEKALEKMPTAGETLANMNKMSLDAKLAFKKKYKQDYGDYLNEKGIVDGTEGTLEKLIYEKEQNLEKIDKGIEAIEGESFFGFEEIADLINDVMDYAEATKEKLGRPKVYNELSRIAKKYRENGMNLLGKEMMYMIRYFRNNNKLAYGEASKTTPLAIKRATNIESAASRRLSKILEDRKFENIKEINMDISKSISIIDELGKNIMREYGLNIPFSEFLQFNSIYDLPANLLKVYLKSNRFKKNYVNWINKKKGFKPKSKLDVDMDKIKESNAERRIQRAYDSAMGDGTPRLNYEGPEVATDAINWAKMRAKDKPNPKDLVIETYANDPYNIPKRIIEWEKAQEVSENPKDYFQKNIWDE